MSLVVSRPAALRERGTSLVELVVSLALGALMLTMMAGSVLALALGEQNGTAAATLASSFETARAEAAMRRLPVAVCGIDTRDAGPETSLRCAHDTWTDGWLTFVDGNGNQRVDEGETVLQVQRTRRVHVQLTQTAASYPAVGFRPTGMLANPVAARVHVQAANTTDPNARAVCVGIDGHVQVISASAPCR